MKPAQLHWHRTESYASPLGFEFRANYRGRIWRMYRLADRSWRVVPSDRPQQGKIFRKPEEARAYASQMAMTNPGPKRNPQDVHMTASEISAARKSIRQRTKKLEREHPGLVASVEPDALWWVVRVRDEDWSQIERDEQCELLEKAEAILADAQGRAEDLKNPTATKPGHWKIRFTTASDVTDSRQFSTKAAAEKFRDEQLRTTGRYHEQVSAQLYEYMDNGTYRARGKPKQSHAKNPKIAENPIRGARKAVSTEVDEYAAQEKKNPSRPRRRKNPSRSRRKNGAGLGALIGSTIGAVAGLGAGSVPLAALGSLLGGSAGGYIAAPKDRKKRGAAGGAIGGALLGPIGAGIGGYVGGTKADADYGGRRNNPGKPAREHNPESIDDIIAHTEGLRVTGEDEVFSLRGYQFEIYGPSSGRYVVELRDPQGNYTTELTAGSKAHALKEAIHYIKVSTDPGYRNNPAASSHRMASISRRISNP